jgi:hypothetical protein
MPTTGPTASDVFRPVACTGTSAESLSFPSDASARAVKCPRPHRCLIVLAVAFVLVVVALAMVPTAHAATSDAAVIRIITSEGTLLVRVDDPDVSVRVEGSEIVVTGSGFKELRLPTGDIATQDSDDGPPVGATIVTITRGDKEILNIRRATALDEEAASASDPPQDVTAADALPATKRLFNPANGHDYQRIDIPMSWRVAKKLCEQLGGHLATATTVDENEFIYRQFGRDHVCWLGATDEEDEGTWKWITGEPWDYENWHAGEPSNNNDGGVENYLTLGNTQPVVANGTSYFYRFGARWNDHVGSGEYHGASIAYPVCEWDEHDPKKAVKATPAIDEPSSLQGFQRTTPPLE